MVIHVTFNDYATRTVLALALGTRSHSWFNYRATRKLVFDGFYEFWNWFDETAWYPLGRVVGGTLYPGSGVLWCV